MDAYVVWESPAPPHSTPILSITMTSSSADEPLYKVVVNHEEQYSIWPVEKALPKGWSEDGTQGTKEECLAHIEKVWTDMRPLSLRKRMQEQEGQGQDNPEKDDSGS